MQRLLSLVGIGAASVILLVVGGGAWASTFLLLLPAGSCPLELHWSCSGGLGARAGPTLFGAAQTFNACLDLAERLGAAYHGLYDLSQGSIVQTVEQSLRGG